LSALNDGGPKLIQLDSKDEAEYQRPLMLYIPPLAWFVIGWLSGVLLGPHIKYPVWVWLTLAVIATFAAYFNRKDKRLRTMLIMVVMFGTGSARYEWAQPVVDEDFVAYYNDKGEVTFEGVVIDEPDVRDAFTQLRVEVDVLRLEDGPAIPVHGMVQVRVPRFPTIAYGERIRIHGELVTPTVFENFNYKDYLARQGVHSLVYFGSIQVIPNPPSANLIQQVQIAFFKQIYAIKGYALAAITSTFPEPQGSLLSGILLGVETSIPASLQDSFRATGTSHIIAISG
jgi:competence protein ComEC